MSCCFGSGSKIEPSPPASGTAPALDQPTGTQPSATTKETPICDAGVVAVADATTIKTANKLKAAVEAADAKYVATMVGKLAGAWPSTDLPSSDFLFGPAFGGGPGAVAALVIAEKYGLRDPILAERDRIALALHVVQLAVCTACGDSRTATEYSGLLPPGHTESWDYWQTANTPSDPGYELNMVVLDAIKALQSCKGVGALERLVTELATAVYKDIPQGEGYVEAKVEELNTRPSQELGFEVGGALAGKYNDDVILMAKWTAEMKGEIEAAVAKLKAGEFGDPAKFHANGRGDLMMIKSAIDDKEITPVRYLIVLAINRTKSFHAKGMQVVLAACGGDRSAYSAGPLKTRDRVSAKCLPGGDYYSGDAADNPNCKLVMDEIRGSVKCKTHAEMERGHVEAQKVFGAPAVVKDRRGKVQRDMLFVFKHEGMFVELQFHFADTLAVKVLAHAVFEIQRLNTDDGSVTASGLHTVMYYPASFEPSSKTAKDVKLLLHI